MLPNNYMWYFIAGSTVNTKSECVLSPIPCLVHH